MEGNLGQIRVKDREHRSARSRPHFAPRRESGGSALCRHGYEAAVHCNLADPAIKAIERKDTPFPQVLSAAANPFNHIGKLGALSMGHVTC
ncbi:hypothetical protein JZ751_004621 [Albula glossodonta]|uniref:Uncharacterized protein n=1 Tax=Albula glossodonta TaxID=121402 RepID=A0A8T2N9U7_9TELE|nr:hypothetical protein JZ751_004621 [Albula glossodonta]